MAWSVATDIPLGNPFRLSRRKMELELFRIDFAGGAIESAGALNYSIPATSINFHRTDALPPVPYSRLWESMTTPKSGLDASELYAFSLGVFRPADRWLKAGFQSVCHLLAGKGVHPDRADHPNPSMVKAISTVRVSWRSDESRQIAAIMSTRHSRTS